MMDKYKQVYIITVGRYSDYKIINVFLDKDSAKQFVRWHNFSNSYLDARLETHEIGKYSGIVEEGWNIYFIKMLKNGDIESIKLDNSVYDPHKFRLNKGKYSGYIKALDKKHAIKIANEKRIQDKAIKTFNDD